MPAQDQANYSSLRAAVDRIMGTTPGAEGMQRQASEFSFAPSASPMLGGRRPMSDVSTLANRLETPAETTTTPTEPTAPAYTPPAASPPAYTAPAPPAASPPAYTAPAPAPAPAPAAPTLPTGSKWWDQNYYNAQVSAGNTAGAQSYVDMVNRYDAMGA